MRTRTTATTALVFGLLAATASPAQAQVAAQPATPDPQMKAVLDELAALGPKPTETLMPAEARKQPTTSDAVKALLKKQGKGTDPEPVAKVEGQVVLGGVDVVPVRIYTPQGDGPFPILVYWHGGGWILADLNTYDATPRALANAAGCIVVSCDYRHAPEHRFPAAADDALSAYQWVLTNAASFNGDPKRVAVGGESAGGNLAAVTALRARDSGMTPPVHQLLIYPVTNAAFDTPSYRQYAAAKPLNAAMMKWFWEYYIARFEDGLNPYASPLLERDAAKLPPATVICAEIDPLQSDGKLYADKLSAAGVKVAYFLHPGVTHEFFGMGAVVDEAKKAVAEAAAGLKSAFGN